jgi:hypothetical protein
MRAAALFGTLALLAGCGGGDYGQNLANGQQQIRIANKHHDDLLQLPPNGQRLAMMRAVRGTGNRCQRVDNTGYQEEYRNMRMWVAVCGAENKSYAVYIAANGDVQVRDCAEAGQLALPRCEGLPPPVSDDSGPEFKQGAADNAFRNQF